MKRTLCMLLSATVTAAGCAGGAWLEGPSEALPLPEQPPRGYPTAVRSASLRPASAEAPAVAQAQPAPQQQPPPPPIDLNPNAPPATPPHLSRVEAPHLPTTSLAVIPPQYVKPQAAPNPLPAPASTPVWQIPPLTLAAEAGLAPIISASNFPLPPPAAVAPPPPVAAAAVSIPTAQPEKTAEERTAELQRLRSELIAAIEIDIRSRRSVSATDEELPRLEQALRLAYLLDGRLDDAVATAEALDEPQRAAYRDLMFALGVWLSPDEARRAPLRSAKVLRSLRDATTGLSAASKLELHNLAFCDSVKSFGWYSEFPRAEFVPKQQVILYVEVDNFSAERKSPGGYETELQGSYQIFDAAGQIVAERQLPLDKETCRNYRRDYFLAYPMYLPDTISPGKYRLELSVEDRKANGKYQGRKFGEGMIEFAIR